MAELWTAFYEDYRGDILNWGLLHVLELFWYYCQDGCDAVEGRIRDMWTCDFCAERFRNEQDLEAHKFNSYCEEK